jgi:hypothetical protein
VVSRESGPRRAWLSNAQGGILAAPAQNLLHRLNSAAFAL